MSAAATISREAALVDSPKGNLSKREDSAKVGTGCPFKAKAHVKLKARAKAQAKAEAEAKAAPQPEPEFDAWGFPVFVKAAPDTSRQRNRKRKVAAARALQGLRPTKADGTPKSRSFTVCICGKFSRNDKGGDLVLEATGEMRTNVKNAQFCGSAWVCPDCATHIGITRGAFVERAINALREAGYRIVMPTTTVPHKAGEPCAVVFDRLKTAHAEMDKNYQIRNAREERGYVGRIRSIEAPHGKNGWHPHSHDIEVYEAAGCETTAAEDNDWALELQRAIYEPFNKIIRGLTGQFASRSHGFTVVPVWSATDYTVKLPEQATKREDAGKPRWGAQAELTKAHVKKAEMGGRTPWEIVDGCYAGNETDIELFREYANATWNRTQFQTTKRLRELLESLGVTIGSDLEIIREEPDFIFADEAHEELENDGDQSKLVADEIRIDRNSQSAAHSKNPSWLENVRHAVELELVMDLPDAMRAEGFELHLLVAAHFVPPRLRLDGGREIEAGWETENTYEPGYSAPNIWRAVWPGVDYVSTEEMFADKCAPRASS